MDVLGTVAAISIDFKNQNVYVTGAGQGVFRFDTHGNLGESAQRK